MEKVAETSFFGQGLSTAFVDLDHVSMFFHNSYLGLLVEGGWPFLIVVVGAYLWLCLRPFARTHRSPRSSWGRCSSRSSAPSCSVADSC